MKTTVALIGLMLISTACSQATKFKPSKPTIAPGKSEEVAQELVKPSIEQEIQKLRDSSWRELYKVVTRIATDKAFTIDALNFSGVRSAAIDLDEEVDILDLRYGTVGEYIDQQDIYLPKRTTSVDFKEALRKANDFFNNENEWFTIKENVLADGKLNDLSGEDPFSGSGGGEMPTASETEDTQKSLCETEEWKTGQDPAVLGNIAACASALTAREDYGTKSGFNSENSFGVDREMYLNNACSAIFVLTTATAAAGLAEKAVCGDSF